MKMLDVPQSGSVAGQTSSRNRFGQYRRTRAVPVNPNSLAQVAARGRLVTLSQNWRTLSDVQRAAWSAYAAEHPKIDSLGQTIVLTGAMAYIGVNAQRMAFGFAASASVPTGAVPDAPVITDITALQGDSVEVTFTPTPVPAAHCLVVECAPPLSAGVTFTSDYRFIAAVAPAATSPQDVYTELQAKFGTLLEGMVLAFRLSLFSSTAGRSPFVNVRTGVSI